MQKKLSAVILIVSLCLLCKPTAQLLTSRADQFIAGKDAIPDGYNIMLPARTEYPASQLGCSSSAATPSSLYAKAYCVIDADSGRVLLQKEGNTQLPMASTTKIMTCILALESGRLSESVEVSSYAASMPDVQLNIRQGEKYLLKDLLYSLMLESHNDTAVAIAEHLGGTVEGFAKQMNEKAQELGCVDTHFVTPNGLDNPEHYTTAVELCKIASYAIENKEFLEIINTKSYSFQEQSGKRRFSVHNHDAFLDRYSGAIGVKTGFTGNAGYCFCGAARRNGQTLISAVLACGWPPNKTWKWADTTKLMDFGFKGFKTTEIPAGEEKYTLPVENGQLASVDVVREETPSLSYPLTAADTITVEVDLPDSLTAPVRAGDIAGYENYYVGEECLCSLPFTIQADSAEIDGAFWREKIIGLFLGK